MFGGNFFCFDFCLSFMKISYASFNRKDWRNPSDFPLLTLGWFDPWPMWPFCTLCHHRPGYFTLPRVKRRDKNLHLPEASVVCLQPEERQVSSLTTSPRSHLFPSLVVRGVELTPEDRAYLYPRLSCGVYQPWADKQIIDHFGFLFERFLLFYLHVCVSVCMPRV